jgi:hypothetical protein
MDEAHRRTPVRHLVGRWRVTETVMHGLRDPFAYLLQELHDRDAGRRPPWAPGQRQQLLDDLLVIEALELAHGKRHVSIAFDNPDDPLVDAQCDELVDVLADALEPVKDLRISRGEGRLTVTVGGPEASEWIRRAEAIIQCLRHSRLVVLETPRA